MPGSGCGGPGRRTPSQPGQAGGEGPGLSGLEWRLASRPRPAAAAVNECRPQGGCTDRMAETVTVLDPGGRPVSPSAQGSELAVRPIATAAAAWSRCWCSRLFQASVSGHDPAEISRRHHRQPAEPNQAVKPITNPSGAVFSANPESAQRAG